MTKETQKVNNDLYYRDVRITSTEDPLQEYYKNLRAAPKSCTEDIEINGQKIPDPRKHQIISFIKSGIRIGGYLAFFHSLELAAFILILSEMVGIGEELV